MLGAGIAALLRRRAAPAAIGSALILAALLAAPSASRADDKDDFAIKATSQTRLAYVVTGNADVDSIVKAGMAGLTLFLAQRTALEAGDPVGVDPAHDELAFFPLIYWPIVPGAPKPPQDALNKIDAYMKQGGTVVFDTRDAVEAPPGEHGSSQTPGMQALMATDTAGGIAGTSLIATRGLVVTSFTPTPGGFSITFNKPFNPGKINPYTLPPAAGFGSNRVRTVTRFSACPSTPSGSAIARPNI